MVDGIVNAGVIAILRDSFLLFHLYLFFRSDKNYIEFIFKLFDQQQPNYLFQATYLYCIIDYNFIKIL